MDQAAAYPFVGFWPRFGKAAVVQHAAGDRTIDLYRSPCLPRPGARPQWTGITRTRRTGAGRMSPQDARLGR